jgi:hypothetical protein
LKPAASAAFYSRIRQWNIKMNISTPLARRSPAKVGKMVLVIAIASAAVGLGIAPVLAADHDNHGHEEQVRGHKTAPVRHNYGHETHRSGYYAPQPVYYAPRPSPGISLFIPLG